MISIAKAISSNVEEAKKVLSRFVSCEDCKYLIKREDAQVVVAIGGIKREKYYCQKDKKPYDVVASHLISQNLSYFKSNVEVDKNGKLIK